MSSAEGARERRKRLTRDAVTRTATELFLERGYDAVSVHDIARAAGVSKMTVFNYFESKEELLFGQLDRPADEPAAVVRRRPAGTGVLAALGAHFITGVRAHDPAVGLCGDERFVALRSLVGTSRVLTSRLNEQAVEQERELATELRAIDGVDELGSRLAAGQIAATRRILIEANFTRVLSGRPLAEQTPLAVADAERAFASLAAGLAHTPFA